MFNFPDLTPLFYLAMFGLFCAAALALGAFGGLIWFAINHMRIV